MPQLRQNIITGEWVVIAPERAKRPSDFIEALEKNKESVENSPFLVGSSAWKKRFKEYDTKNTYTIANLFPAFVCDETMCETRSYYPEKSFYRAKSSVGDHDVIVIKDPKQDLFSFTQKTWEDLLTAFQSRYIKHSKNEAVEHIMCIYNHGARSGASIEHPHAQIFASPIVPNYVQKELSGSERYFNNNGVSVFEDIVLHEKAEKIRIIAENKEFLAFTFYAARFPFETWVMPKKQAGHFEKINPTERKSLARFMRIVLSMIDKTLKNPSLNFWIHTLPTTINEAKHFCWHIEIAPRVARYGGYELGSGVVIDVVSPEKAAQYLRKNA